MGRPEAVYRGKRRYRWIISAVLIFLAVLAFLAIWLFNYMQRYIVYDRDGLRVILPFEEGYSSEPDSPAQSNPGYTDLVDAEIVVDEPDYSQLDIGAGEGLEDIKAKYISAQNVSAASISDAGRLLEQDGRNALVVQLKNESGILSYLSSVQIPSSYGVNGTDDISGSIAELKEKGVYLVAEICCLEDNALAERYAPIALKNSQGSVIYENNVGWLDPYSTVVRSYISSLIAELAQMGFDEVLLSGVAHPKATDVVFSQSMIGEPSLDGGVSSFALKMRNEAETQGMKCSALVSEAQLHAGSGASIGQSLDIFARIFDRLYVKTDTYFIEADTEAISSALGGTATGRTVPIVSGYTPETASWASE